MKPVENQVPFVTERSSHFLQGLDLAPHGASTPGVEKLAGPGRAGIPPESLVVLPHQVTPDALEVVLQQLFDLRSLSLCEIPRAVQHNPTTTAEHRLVAVILQLLDFCSTNVVDGLVEALHHVKPVENMNGVARLLTDDFQVTLPHVAADELQPRRPLLSQKAKEPQ